MIDKQIFGTKNEEAKIAIIGLGYVGAFGDEISRTRF